MTQTICAIDAPPGSRTPFHTRVTLTCDGDHGLLRPAVWTAHGGDYMAMRAAATKDGWKRADGGRWLCPECR